MKHAKHTKQVKRKMMKRRIGLAAAVWGIGLSAAFGAHAQTMRKVSTARTHASTTIEDRWRESLDAFAAADKMQAPRTGGVLFVGSSSIRLWSDLEAQFTSYSVVKRGFGGSRMADCARYVEQLVLPYAPKTIIVYAGDNDLAEGGSPQGVLASFTEFVERVRAELPDTRIAYVSIKPSPLRAALMPAALQTNALIEQYTRSEPNLDYIDIYSKMLDEQGHPRADLFQADHLHLNPAGYAIWKSAITEHLRLPAPLRAAQAGS